MTEKEFWMININKQKDRGHSRPFRIKLDTLNLEIVGMILQFRFYPIIIIIIIMDFRFIHLIFYNAFNFTCH